MVRLVFDIGTAGIRVGRATDSIPLAEIPTTVGVLKEFPEDEPRKKYVMDRYKLDTASESMECVNLIKDGMIEDWDLLEKILDHIYLDCIRSLPTYHPLLISEFPWNTTKNREKLTEIMFETYKVPTLFLAKSPGLASIANGISTGLVVDSGASFTTVVPVINGLTQTNALVKSPIAGNYINNGRNIEITQPYVVGTKEPKFFNKHFPPPKVTKSWYDYNMKTCADEIKNTVLEVSDIPYQELQLGNTTSKSIRLPNKTTFRYKLAEVMFNPNIYMEKKRLCMEMGVSQLVETCLSKLDEVTRKSMNGRIVLTGGNSYMKGFDRRLINDLAVILPGENLKVNASNTCSGRRLQAWIGGSKLASNQMFHTIWMTRTQYNEHGKTYACYKFP